LSSNSTIVKPIEPIKALFKCLANSIVDQIFKILLLTILQLWYALGKMRAEKAAWRIANERGLKLTTICPALVTGPEFCHRNPTATIAYLKGIM